MSLSTIAKTVEHTLRDNAPAILTSLGVSGTLTTAYLAAKASFKAAKTIDLRQRYLNVKESTRRPMETKEKVEIVWKFYIPTAVSAGLTIACIVSGAKIGTAKTAAAVSLLTVSERAFDEYKEKVVEQIGVKKEQGIRDQIAEERVRRSTEGQPVVVIGAGNVLCCELFTGRIFNCDMETIRKAVNTINAQMIRENDATLSDFYHLVGLPETAHSGYAGWTSEKMLELDYSTVMTPDQRPCIAFSYNYFHPF